MEVPDDPSVTLVGAIVHVTPTNGETVSVSVTVPVNPLRGATTIVEVPTDPALTVIDEGLARILKSWIV